ncbi:hypothetical protein AMK01_CH03832 [Rhizobium sp. N6212]|nr:hypothetical protein AMK01_CH03832 [Rhizobium sp. N6212]ANK99283.1 hypothetical protein AMK00_CH03835 [Rhizobium sp. N621]ANL05414.1 hypothetical protein AMJ99_CH03914 [Rhizobium esperanzae]ANL11468.1 hypothetical protein AMJ98_CH03862 [Rhizobium sp. N1341]ANM36254.1 hypothetical protein AMK04_CH03919 [Rhizobium sp. N871]ANM42313.1 hypothetical protein AMK03_CH03866 [Rhizobium sp. N741]
MAAGRMNKSIALMTALLSLTPAVAFAHPHIFVEARLEVVAGADGSVEELRNVWRFDEVFSSSVVMDFDKNTDLKLEPNELAQVGKTVKQSLADYDYYMNLTINGKSITVQQPDIIHVDYKNGQLLMFFAVKPAEKMPLKGRLTFGVYDPTLYTSIDFPTDNELATVGDGLKACKHQVVRPDADEVISQNKQSLTDAFFNDPTGTNMSKLFATRLELTC